MARDRTRRSRKGSTLFRFRRRRRADVRERASGADKKARCARLTADVAGKVAELLNGYLSTGAYTAAFPSRDATSAHCATCHTPTAAAPPSVASGMACGPCHANKVPPNHY